MNNNFFSEQVREFIKNYALEAFKRSLPNEAKLANLTDKLRDLIREVESLPPALCAEAKDLLIIAAAKEYGVNLTY